MRDHRIKLRDPIPVERIEVSHKNIGPRVVAFWILVVIAVVAIALGIYFWLRTEKGWQVVEPRSSAKTNCSNEFRFYYYVNGKSSDNRAELRAAQDKYTELTVTMYELFSPYDDISDVRNVYYINRNLNEPIYIDSVLYKAFEKVSSSRFIYGAPVQAFYESLCSSRDDTAASLYDPARNSEAKAFYEKILAFANDENHVNIELLGDNKIILHVSEEYVAYAKENEIKNFIDFSYYKNAFIIDHMVEELNSIGLTSGLIVSYDGYTRTLSEQNCIFDIYSKLGNSYHQISQAKLSKSFSAIALHSYATSGIDGALHYVYKDGTTAHAYFDMNDAMSKCANDCFVVYSSSKNCADLIDFAYPVWVADTFDKSALAAYGAEDVYYAYAEETTTHYSDSALTVELPKDTEDRAYYATLDSTVAKS